MVNELKFSVNGEYITDIARDTFLYDVKKAYNIAESVGMDDNQIKQFLTGSFKLSGDTSDEDGIYGISDNTTSHKELKIDLDSSIERFESKWIESQSISRAAKERIETYPNMYGIGRLYTDFDQFPNLKSDMEKVEYYKKELDVLSDSLEILYRWKGKTMSELPFDKIISDNIKVLKDFVNVHFEGNIPQEPIKEPIEEPKPIVEPYIYVSLPELGERRKGFTNSGYLAPDGRFLTNDGMPYNWIHREIEEYLGKDRHILYKEGWIAMSYDSLQFYPSSYIYENEEVFSEEEKDMLLKKAWQSKFTEAQQEALIGYFMNSEQKHIEINMRKYTPEEFLERINKPFKYF